MKFDVLASLSATPSLQLLVFLAFFSKLIQRPEFPLLLPVIRLVAFTGALCFHTAMGNVVAARARHASVTQFLRISVSQPRLREHMLPKQNAAATTRRPRSCDPRHRCWLDMYGARRPVVTQR